MRHASIDTTLRFYVGKNANTAVAAVWQSAGRPKGNTPGDWAYQIATTAPTRRLSQGEVNEMLGIPMKA